LVLPAGRFRTREDFLTVLRPAVLRKKANEGMVDIDPVEVGWLQSRESDMLKPSRGSRSSPRRVVDGPVRKLP
jgi:hypothetical protein